MWRAALVSEPFQVAGCMFPPNPQNRIPKIAQESLATKVLVSPIDSVS